MTVIKQGVASKDMKEEVRQLRSAAREVLASKEAARRFLVSTGMYTASGKIKARFR